jgi:hypothetical protein
LVCALQVDADVHAVKLIGFVLRPHACPAFAYWSIWHTPVVAPLQNRPCVRSQLSPPTIRLQFWPAPAAIAHVPVSQMSGVPQGCALSQVPPTATHAAHWPFAHARLGAQLSLIWQVPPAADRGPQVPQASLLFAFLQ